MLARFIIHRRLLLRMAAEGAQWFGQISQPSLLQQMEPEIQIHQLAIAFVVAAAGLVPPEHHYRRFADVISIPRETMENGGLAIHHPRTAETIAEFNPFALVVDHM